MDSQPPGTPVPWLFPGQSPVRPAVDILLGVRLHRYGIDAHAGRNTARMVLAAELPASGAGRPYRHQHRHRRALVPVGQARLGRLRRPARRRRPRKHRQPETR